ncbi:hypothetical protein [Paenisporosarcina cavernae]|uniref:Lipoprotein n=1 Tax=Paenisporosarcina cavernae TaxID=2320858 RepID=A0A385YTQ7_9BACL|nr:hypothetical protein [Paenisporosarcina cavernae]AYC30046.1 hypothetical protein D3873_09230 [Paenisporosarcina cavernae]
MKKLGFLVIAASLLLAACNDDKEATNTSNNETASEETSNVSGDMMKFYFSVSKTINQADADLNAFEGAQAKEELPEGDELATMKEAAKTSALETKSAIEGLEIPAELDAQKADIEAALTDFANAYQMKADALEASADANLEAANEAMVSADEKLNKVLEDTGLAPSSITNEVSA